jgi:hypothetical protein
MVTMNRESILLASLHKQSKALEFGALDRPLIDKRQHSVKYVDFTDRESLAAKLVDTEGVVIDKLVEVDIVWQGTGFCESLGAYKPIDFVVASHVFEHLPNPLGWLETLAPVLSKKGCISLAIPDKRYTFDHARSSTPTSEWVAAKLENRSVPSVNLALEAVMYFTPVETQCAWGNRYPDRKLLAPETFEHYLGLAKGILADGVYHDVHCSVFTPYSFAELMLETAYYGLHEYSFSDFFPTRQGDMEFFVHLVVCDDRERQLSRWAALLHQLG